MTATPLTTFWGNLAMLFGVLGAMGTALGLMLPQGGAQVYVTAVGAACTAGGVYLNGIGNRHSQTGTPET